MALMKGIGNNFFLHVHIYTVECNQLNAPLFESRDMPKNTAPLIREI